MQILGIGFDLADAVAARNGGHDWLKERPAEQLDLAPLNEPLEPLDVLGPVINDPLHQRAGAMQRDGDLGYSASSSRIGP